MPNSSIRHEVCYNYLWLCYKLFAKYSHITQRTNYKERRNSVTYTQYPRQSAAPLGAPPALTEFNKMRLQCYTNKQLLSQHCGQRRRGDTTECRIRALHAQVPTKGTKLANHKSYTYIEINLTCSRSLITYFAIITESCVDISNRT